VSDLCTNISDLEKLIREIADEVKRSDVCMRDIGLGSVDLLLPQ